MKKNLFLLVCLLTICLQSDASITAEQMTEPDYIINNGYSEAIAEEVLISKDRAMGRPIEPLAEKRRSRFTRFMRNVYSYIDPSQDSDERFHHDIHQSTNWKDL